MPKERSLVGPREPCAACGLDWPNTEQEKIGGRWYCGACAKDRRPKPRDSNPYPLVPDAIPPGPPPDLGSALLRLGWHLAPLGHDAMACGQVVASELDRLQLAVREERQACARIAREQPFYPDTHTGMRQQWVKDQIVEKILARGDR